MWFTFLTRSGIVSHGFALLTTNVPIVSPEEEFRKNYLTPAWDTSYDAFLKQALIPNDLTPEQFDWREHGAVTPVKNQVRGHVTHDWVM